MDSSPDLLRKGFHLAHFIVSDRATALQIAGDATGKLEVYRNQERKRSYWRHKHLKRKITRVIRQDDDMFQWLIYFEAERHEKHHEQAGRSTRDDLVIRYIKHLAQITTPMSSFYVNVGFQRLLRNYTTAETRSIYELMTNHFPGNEEYRKVKTMLLNRLKTRFGNLLKTCQCNRGELKFEPYERQEDLADLVGRCLSEFTPWSTSQTCCLSAPVEEGLWPGNKNLAGKSGNRSLDAVETYRSHIFIHSPCFTNLIQHLGLDSSWERFSVPRFFLHTNGDHEGTPSASREPAPDLTEQERQTIAGRLNREALKRQQIDPKRLRILVDGHEVAQIALSHRHPIWHELQEAARLIEVWTADGDEDILLAMHWIDHSELHRSVKAEARIDLGRTHQLRISIIPGDTSARIRLDLRRKRVLTLWKGRPVLSNWRQAWPKYALTMSAVLLMGAAGVVIGYRDQAVKQRQTIDSINRELTQERAARAGIQQQPSNSAEQLTASFRLLPDQVEPRGSHGQDVRRLTIPLRSNLVSLELPVNSDAQERYRVRLNSFSENKPILEEDSLKPISFANNDSHVAFMIPAAFLVPDTYYVVMLEILDPHGKPLQSRTFTFSVAYKK
ncbi:MAG TPA: hypothetical protein VKH81_04380 [Candidatus Angelobacter sp.]|nr:hypothetical protein [Candidatus Angelobacter sp.]